MKALRLFILALVCLVTEQAAASTAEQLRLQATQQELKTAFLYNFTKFIEWPEGVFPDSSSPFTICVLADSDVGSAVEKLKDKTVATRKIVTRQLSTSSNGADCQLLYIGTAAKVERVEQLLASLQKLPVLTVGSAETFNGQGGIIRFVNIGNRIAFEINQPAARKARLMISSKLLNLARKNQE